MKTMLEELRVRLDQAIADRKTPMVHVSLKPWRRGDDDEQLHRVTLENVGADFIQVRDRLISRNAILEIQPINF